MQRDRGRPPPSLAAGISSQVAAPAGTLLASRSAGVKLERRGLMQLAGYFCPTTEEVAGESQDPAPPEKKQPSLPPSPQRLRTSTGTSPGGP